MTKNKLCCRIYPIVVILISLFLASLIWYFDEDIHQLTFLYNWREFINFFGSALFIAVLPIGLFYYLNDKEKYEQYARLWALLGFMPAIIFILILIL